jgi:mannose-6-phosphate isomerase-like protein (cupin superfamily)
MIMLWKNVLIRKPAQAAISAKTSYPFKGLRTGTFCCEYNQAAKQNDYFRIALWTGNHLQITLMSINVGEDIGLEMHPDLDQFIRIEQGQGLVRMGERQDRLNFERRVYDDYAFVIPAGTWHNLINTGNVPIKLYSIYAPPQHPRETIHKTKADAED